MWLKKERNELFQILSANAADPVFFEVVTEEKSDANLRNTSILTLRARDEHRFAFVAIKNISQSPLQYAGVPVTQIGIYRPLSNLVRGDYGEFLAAFAEWSRSQASVWVTDVIAVDLWQQVAAFAALRPVATGPTDHTQFTADEKGLIKKGLIAFQEKISETYHPTPLQEAQILAELKHLSDTVDRLEKRIDWRGVAIGGLVNIATALALSPDQLQALGELFSSAMRAVLRLP